MRFDGARIGQLADRVLPAWFLLWSALRVHQLSWTGVSWDTGFLGRDFRIYRAAGEAVLKGTDPWAAFAPWNGVPWHFAALPPAAQLFAPFALLPEGLGTVLFGGLSVAVAWLAFRRLGLPGWWLLFPPLTEGLLAVNPQILLFGCLIAGGPVARAVATMLKVYAIVPVVARREFRAVALTLGFTILSAVAGATLWATWVNEFGAISTRVVQESHGGVSAAILLDPKIFGQSVAGAGIWRFVPGILLYGVIALLVIGASLRDVRGAAWVAVPLLWPAAEYHLATLAIPAARRLSIWVIAVATPPTYLLGLILLTYEVSVGRRALVREPSPQGLVSWVRALRPAWPGPAPADTRPRPAS